MNVCVCVHMCECACVHGRVLPLQTVYGFQNIFTNFHRHVKVKCHVNASDINTSSVSIFIVKVRQQHVVLDYSDLRWHRKMKVCFDETDFQKLQSARR